jgi:ferredoxin
MKRMKAVFCFPPSKVEEPIVYQLITDYGLMVNILRASIDPRKQGRMVVELTGDDSRLTSGLNYLELSGVVVDTLTEDIQHLKERCTSCTACVPICPTGALEVNRESWSVSYDADKCVVCLSCVDACPYRAIETYVE